MFNADGKPAGACGNGTLCGAAGHGSLGCDEVGIEILPAIWRAGGRLKAMSLVLIWGRCHWSGDIPTNKAVDTLAVDLGFPELGVATLVPVGNPHAVFFIENAEAVDPYYWGHWLSIMPCSLIGPISNLPRFLICKRSECEYGNAVSE